MAEGSKCRRSEAIVIISSDEDDEEDVQDLFKAFVSQVERYVEQNDVVLLLKLKFAEARPEFVSSVKFKSALKWRTTQMNKANGYIYTGDICKLLLGDSKTDDSKAKLDGVKEEVDRDASSAGNKNVVIPSSRAEPDVNKTIIRVTIDNGEEDDLKTVVKGMPAEFTNPQPSTSTTKPSTSLEDNGKIKKKRKLHAATTTTGTRATTKSNPEKELLSPRKRKQLVEKLKLKLDYLGDQIKILSRAELSLEEMDMSESTYIQECRMKERFNRIYNKICKLQGHPPVTGRVTEREVKCPTTRVAEIDRAVNKFLKEKKSRFPDIFDIRNVVFEANKQHGLKLPVQALNEISDEVFMCVGNKLQKRRKRDFENNFGCALTDDYQPGNDPAITDLALRKKLEENKRISKRNLDDVFNKFTHYGRMAAYDDSSSSSDGDSENLKPQNGHVKSAMKRKFSHISVSQSSDSSEHECDDLGLEEDGSDDNNPNTSMEVRDDGSTSGKQFVGKSNKKHLILKCSDTSENDLEDFAIKTSRQVMKRKENTDNDTTCDTNDSTALPSIETNLSIAELAELPNSILFECDDSSIERTAVAELDGTLQQTEIESEKEAKSSEIDDLASVSENHEITLVQDISPDDVVSSSQQGNEAWTDSNVSDDLSSQSSELYTPSLKSQSIPSDDVISIVNSDVMKPQVSSNSSNVIDSHVVAEKTPKENGSQKPLLNSILSANAVDKNFKSSISIPLTPVSLKGHKSLCLSTKKRKAENGSLEYESPLKILREARMEILEKKQEASLNQTDSTDKKSSCKRRITLLDSDNKPSSSAILDSPPVQATTNGQSAVKKSESRRLTLSLNKGRNSPSSKQKVVERTAHVIVLSDDDSDS